MATQTRSKRQAAGKKAAATRKTNQAKRSATTTKSSARRTARTAKSSAKATAKSSRGTARQAARTTGRGVDAATTRIDAFGRQAQRAMMIQVGVAVALRDALSQVAETYTNLDRVLRELDHFERRGEGAVRRGKQTLRRRRREVQHDVRSARRTAGRQTNGLRSDAEDVLGRIKSLA